MKRPYALCELPEGYQLLKLLDLVKETKLFIILNVFGIGLFIASWVILTWLLAFVRPRSGAGEISFAISSAQFGSFIIWLLVIMLVFFAMITLHEAIHGLFFWLFTRSKVKFAFKGTHAYAAAPDWYIAKGPYLVVCLAPLVLMTVIGMLVMLFVPLSWINAIMLLVTMNIAGAIGDIYVFSLLLRMPGDVLVQDNGDNMEIFSRAVTIKD